MLNDKRYGCVYWEMCCCDGYNNCTEYCEKYASFGTQKYDILKKQYDIAIDAATQPVVDNFRKLFNEGKL